jgi:hypothetical protein
MPHSTIHSCPGCGIAIDNAGEGVEFIERRQIDNGGTTLILPMQRFTHVRHELGGKAQGWTPTGRVGVVNDLRDTWREPKA